MASGASDSMKRKMFVDALIFLGQNGALRMHSKLESATIPNTLVSGQSLLVNCLQLADYVGVDDERIKTTSRYCGTPLAPQIISRSMMRQT